MSRVVAAKEKAEAESIVVTAHGLHTRYPGPRSFSDDDIDRRLFFGREQEIEYLLHRIRASRMLVVFGKSGLGKTSLLQAGLYPRLRERGLLPVTVRFNQPDVGPVDAVLNALRATCQEQKIDYEPREAEGLWEFFKTTDLWRGDVLQTPVLVLDQFEEIFNLQMESARTILASQLGDLVGRGLPARIRQRLEVGEEARYNDTPPEIKVVLSLREEYVAALEQLVPIVPAIFDQRFRLAPLNKNLARSAVVEPALLNDPGTFGTQPFQYVDTTLDTMMSFLVNRHDEVEPFQLQIVCRHLEEEVALRQRNGSRDVKVDETLLGGRKTMERLSRNFYRDALQGILSWLQRSRARRLCELGLLSPDGHRVSVEHGQILKDYRVTENTLQKLCDARLIRKEARTGLEGFYYELSHDSVAKAVKSSRRFRVSTRAKLGSVVLLIFAMATLLLQRKEIEVQEQVVQAAKQQALAQEEVAKAAKQVAEAQQQLSEALRQKEQRKAAEAADQRPETQRQTRQAAKQVTEAERKVTLATGDLLAAELLATEIKKYGGYQKPLQTMGTVLFECLTASRGSAEEELQCIQRFKNGKQFLGQAWATVTENRQLNYIPRPECVSACQLSYQGIREHMDSVVRECLVDGKTKEEQLVCNKRFDAGKIWADRFSDICKKSC